MSKSIYEEALKELTWLVHDEFDENPERSRLNVSQRLDMFKKVKDTLEQAQKQEKLLELYKEINNKRKELITLARYNTWSWKLDIEIKEIQDKIKELEK